MGAGGDAGARGGVGEEGMEPPKLGLSLAAGWPPAYQGNSSAGREGVPAAPYNPPLANPGDPAGRGPTVSGYATAASPSTAVCTSELARATPPSLWRKFSSRDEACKSSSKDGVYACTRTSGRVDEGALSGGGVETRGRRGLGVGITLATSARVRRRRGVGDLAKAARGLPSSLSPSPSPSTKDGGVSPPA